MVSFWPWAKEDSSPAIFEKTLSTLSTKITATQTQLDKTRSTSRRVKLLGSIYLAFAYLVYTIVLFLVVGWRHMGALEWTGMAGGPVLIYVVRAVTTAGYEYRISKLSTRLKAYQSERNKTIQKLKDATKYDSTLELLEKYGGAENKPKKGKKRGDEDEGQEAEQKKSDTQRKQGVAPSGRTNLPPPPTANIQRHASSAPGTPAPRAQVTFGTPQLGSRVEDDTSAEFAPNAFDGKMQPQPVHYPPAPATTSSESHWYDRILDTLLGEDETAAKNRIVLICSRCRLVNGQAPPGTKSLSELGTWKCIGCGALNGEEDEGKRIIKEVLAEQAEAAAESTEGEGDLVGVEDRDDADKAEGRRMRKKGN
ncbi:hypothetical protein OQA88_4542 [Cercophora sp. LCS_1]